MPLPILVAYGLRAGGAMLLKKVIKSKLGKEIKEKLKKAIIKKFAKRKTKKRIKELKEQKEARRVKTEKDLEHSDYLDPQKRNPLEKQKTLEPLSTGRKQMEYSIKAIRSNNKVARNTTDKETLATLAKNTKMHKANIAKFKKPRREARGDIRKNRGN
jgi:hypothetical protein